MSSHAPLLYLVDGFNLLHAAILKGRERQHWWGVAAQRRVVALVDQFSELKGLELSLGKLPVALQICVVFDRRQSTRLEQQALLESCTGTAGVEVQHAPSADDWIVDRCTERQRLEGSGAGIAPESPIKYRTVVVSADRALLDRCAHRGAERLSPWVFAQMCEATSIDRATQRCNVE